MTAKSRIDKLSKVIKPKGKPGQLVEIEIPVNTIYGTGEKDKIIKIQERQLNEMNTILEKVYGSKDSN